MQFRISKISKLLKNLRSPLEEAWIFYLFLKCSDLPEFVLSLSFKRIEKRTCLTNSYFQLKYALPKLLIDVRKRNLLLPALFADKIRILILIRIIILAKNSSDFID